MDDYVRKINYRNAKIDEYNALWARLGDLQGQLSKINADKDSKAIELARSEKPILAHRVAAFDNLYSRARGTGLKYLYRMGRAYSREEHGGVTQDAPSERRYFFMRRRE